MLMSKTVGAVCLLMAAWLMLGSVALASTITGTVVNLSRNKPPSGDDVVLYRVDKSMHEVTRAKTDVHGAFRLEAPAGVKYLVAAIHDKITYHTSLLMGSGRAKVLVYDAVSRLAAVHESSSTLYPELEGSWLKITQFFVVSNLSVPARTLNTPFSFELPQSAVLISAAVQPPGTLPFLIKASACGGRDRYCITSPIRPGETRVRVIFRLGFHAGVPIALPLLHPVDQVLVKIPESLDLQSNALAVFRNHGSQNRLSIYSIDCGQACRAVSFALSPSTPKATGAIGEMTALRSALESPDAGYEMSSHLRKATTPRLTSSPDSRSPVSLIVLLAVLVAALLGLFVSFARSSRPSVEPLVSELALSQKGHR
jgi:hypothetical protein